MIDLHSSADLELLRESIDLECKLAAGREGHGALPEDFWPTYSAFANTNGGVVLLGVREKKGQFHLEGIANSAKVRKELFDNLNNRQKVSFNLLSDADVRGGYLESHNPGRGAVYCLPGAGLPTPEDVFGGSSDYLPVSSEHLSDSSGHFAGSSGHLPDSSRHLDGSSEHLPVSSEHSRASSEHLAASSEHSMAERDEYGRRLSSHLDAPILDSLECLPHDYKAKMKALANAARSGRLSQSAMRSIILDLCEGQYVTGPSLANLLQRSPDALRQQHLKPLVVSGQLRLAFPTTPTHQMQAYRTTESE